MPTKPSPKIAILQVLRAVAAGMVVWLHADFVLSPNGAERAPHFLGAGVDIFFVISGFVIALTAPRFMASASGWWEFLLRRMIRIVPLCWFALTLRLLVLALGSYMGKKVFPSFTDILTSYLFIPHDTQGLGPRYPFPILDVAWTLNYEMFFYVVFAVGLALFRGKALWITCATLVAGVVVTSIVPPSILPINFWFHPIILEFVAGAAISSLYTVGVRIPLYGSLCLMAASVWLLTGIDMHVFESFRAPGFYSFPRAIFYGGSAACLVAALTLHPFNVSSFVGQRLGKFGASSYALYLLHPFIFLPAHSGTFAREHPVFSRFVLVGFAIVVAFAIAHQFHLRVEVPVTRWLSSRLAAYEARRDLKLDNISNPRIKA